MMMATRTEDNLMLPVQSYDKENEGKKVLKGKASPTNEEENPNSPTAAEKKGPENSVTAQLTKTKMCAFFSRGRCASTNCRYAHSSDELRKLPNLQKTKLCKAFLQGNCSDQNCQFAHGEEDLRVTEGIYKTQICNFYERGYCKKGDRCNHAHGIQDLRPSTSANKGSVPKSQASLENKENQEPPVSKPKPEKSRLPLAELLIDDNVPKFDYTLDVVPTPTNNGYTSPIKSGSFAIYNSPTGVGQTPEYHWAPTFASSIGQNPMHSAIHPMSPSSLHPMSPSSGLYPASPLGIPTPSPTMNMMLPTPSPTMSHSMLPLGTLDALMAQHDANPQSGTPGFQPVHDPALLGAPSSMEPIMEALMATQHYRNEPNQSVLQQQQVNPLTERLASLDACVRDLAADVRNFQTVPPAAMPMTRAAPAPRALFRDITNIRESENVQEVQPKSFRI